MYKPLFLTAMMSLFAAVAHAESLAETRPGETHAVKQCPDGKYWDDDQQKCVMIPRGSH